MYFADVVLDFAFLENGIKDMSIVEELADQTSSIEDLKIDHGQRRRGERSVVIDIVLQ